MDYTYLLLLALVLLSTKVFGLATEHVHLPCLLYTSPSPRD